mmetsp:Transcript_18598/g.38313  ORF Transcript_18598/g.38313 Transcript_18598/m.38313 type:complete len:377 (-) Transcript_18598:413-1543(-)
MVASDKSVSMQKWGIPEDEMVSAEVTLLERLVWVPYNDHWWPALLYDDYSELQDQLYKELDVVSKAQFATAIMRQLNNPKPIKVARLLGREVLEVVEVMDTEYAEFYWQLPKVLPMACRKSNYGNDTKRYLDFHRALDQVEEIIRDISENSFNLVPGAGKKTWLQRAQEALAYPEVKSSIERDGTNLIQKEVADREGFNFLFSALDGMMENCNNTYDCVSGNVDDKIVEEEPLENNPHKMALSKQRETRASLRRALERQRQIREGGSVACIADDDTREGVVRSPSTEVLPAVSGDESFFWNMLNPREEPTMTRTSPKKSMMQPRSPSRPTPSLIDSREEYEGGDREAIFAAARAAAAIELETSFWDALTCNTTEQY